MRYSILILVLILLLSTRRGYTRAGRSHALGDSDTTISIPNSDMKVRIRLYDPKSEDPDENNAVIALINKRGKVIFVDSLHMGHLDFWFEDYSGDGVKDLVLHRYMLASRSNMAYNLYVVDSSRRTLRKVVGFDKVLNPTYDEKRKLIKSMYLYGEYQGWSYYRIDRNGRLRKVSRDYKERVG
jgi:hypothetical protein